MGIYPHEDSCAARRSRGNIRLRLKYGENEPCSRLDPDCLRQRYLTGITLV